jgi:hypothetical protein
MDAKSLAELYDLPLLDWAGIEARLDGGISQAPDSGGPNRHTWWLTTINGDGSPHVTGIGALWADGTFWSETGAQTRKAKNLARDPRRLLSVATHEFDLAVEGTAAGRSPTVASQHLSKLRFVGPVEGVRNGHRVVYRIRGGHVRRLLEEALFHADHQVTGEPVHD